MKTKPNINEKNRLCIHVFEQNGDRSKMNTHRPITIAWTEKLTKVLEDKKEKNSNEYLNIEIVSFTHNFVVFFILVKTHHLGKILATMAIERIRDTRKKDNIFFYKEMISNVLPWKLPVIVKCQLDWTMLPIQEILILSNCDRRIQRWYEAIHHAILNIELHRLNIWGTENT